MKTNRLPKLLGCRLIGVLVLLLFSFVVDGQTYRLLKAGNDNSAAVDRDEVSKVVTPEELNAFNYLRVTSNMVGAEDGQELTLAKIPGTCQRTHSSIPDFNSLGLSWIKTNPNLRTVVLLIKKAEDLNQFAATVEILNQSTGIHYLILQTVKELYPNIDPSMYETTGLNLITPVVSDKLNTLYSRGIRVFFTVTDFK